MLLFAEHKQRRSHPCTASDRLHAHETRCVKSPMKLVCPFCPRKAGCKVGRDKADNFNRQASGRCLLTSSKSSTPRHQRLPTLFPLADHFSHAVGRTARDKNVIQRNSRIVAFLGTFRLHTRVKDRNTSDIKPSSKRTTILTPSIGLILMI